MNYAAFRLFANYSLQHPMSAPSVAAIGLTDRVERQEVTFRFADHYFYSC